MSKIIKSAALHSNPKVITAPQQCVIEEVPEVEPETKEEPLAENELLVAAKLEAESILSDASTQADKLLQETHQCIEQLKTEAYHDGFQKGFAQGSEEGHAAALANAASQIAEAQAEAKEIILAARGQAHEMLQLAETQIVDIALTIARKVLKREIDENPMTILPIVKEALSKVVDQDNIVLRVNPDDTELLEHAKRDLQHMIGGDKKLAIVADHTVSPGGCLIDTESGTVDASIDTQFAIIKQALRSVMP